MFKNNTVLVVGAGASSECRLPVGTGLAEKISYLLDFEFEQYGFGDLKKGDQSILNALKINSNKESHHLWKKPTTSSLRSGHFSIIIG